MSTADPFANLATGYDAAFSRRSLGVWLRQRVHDTLDRVLPTKGRVLDLGCGTGEDALWLAQRGLDVDAVDSSAMMLELANDKIMRAGLGAHVRFHECDLNADLTPLAGPYDAAVSDFGALNAVENRVQFARSLGRLLRTEAPLVAVVMGPLCPWEVAVSLWRAQPAAAFRRFKQGRPATLPGVGDGEGPALWYPGPGRLRADFAPWFQDARFRGIGTLLPASAMGGLVERWPRAFDALKPLDAWLGKRAVSAWVSDHYALVA
ncbi:MAG TPA: class I SAM-dependent methyltransferase, partial [Candidatus Krumholzibacteria bacterium]